MNTDPQAIHISRLISSYQDYTRTPFPKPSDPAAIHQAPYILVSHGTQPDPIFNYGNLAALKLFEMTWEEFTALASRHSAEPVGQAERDRLLEEVSAKGYIADYSGIRISKSGRRFKIENATVWNIIDTDGKPLGQAAMFDRWQYL